MPKYCLSEYTGAGTDADPYRPLGVEQGMIWSAIDFRPDSTILDGFCIVVLPDEATIPKRVMQIAGSKVERLSNPAKSLFANRIGLNLDTQNFDEILLELLTTHSTPPNDKTRWNPIAPTVDKRFEIWLGEKVVDIPFVAGGATYTESFDKADSSTLGPDLTWTEITGNADVYSNQYSTSSTAGLGAQSRAESDLSSSDNYAQATCYGNGDTYPTWYVACRHSSSAHTCYRIKGTNILSWAIDKVVTGTATQLGSSTSGTPTTIYGSANGTTIIAKRNGTQVISVTDSSITTGVRGGLGVYCYDTSHGTAMDSFEMGDLATSATTTPSTIVRSFLVNAPTLNSAHGATVIARSFAINAPTLTANSTIATSTIARSFAMPAPTTVGGSGAYPDAIALSVAFPTPTVTGNSVVVDSTGSGNSLDGKRRRGSTIGKGKSGR